MRLTSNHALGELFANLTSGRLPIQLTPVQAAESLKRNIVRAFAIYSFTTDDYLSAAALCGKVGARGGAFYDVLHLQAARKIDADEILTLNLRHFAQFAPDLADKIRSPR